MKGVFEQRITELLDQVHDLINEYIDSESEQGDYIAQKINEVGYGVNGLELYDFKSFKDKINSSDYVLKNKDEIKAWLNYYNIDRYKINSDLSVDVDEHVNLSSKELTCLPFKFNNIYGVFDISHNDEITNFDNMPSFVDNDCILEYTEFDDLTKLPLMIKGDVVLPNCYEVDDFFENVNPKTEIEGEIVTYYEGNDDPVDITALFKKRQREVEKEILEEAVKHRKIDNKKHKLSL